ncbi:MAG: T9SS type A sorting domain-containing protein [Candidatus Cloacimonetes bacterium]|nr:T9SS type A sorting domain-containing protein [Candidatus Cloacimonadota bacterium]
MKKVLFLSFTLLLAQFLCGDYVQIGTGNVDTYYVPTCGLYDYSWSGTIYLQSEIGSSININKISYEISGETTDYTMLAQKIYMKHTTELEFTAGTYPDPENNGFTLVYENNVTWNGPGWSDINLETAFQYNGTDNLIVVYENHDGNWVSNYPEFCYTNQTNRTIHKLQDNTFPTEDGAIGWYMANIRLHYIVEDAPGQPSTPNPENNSVNISSFTDISWLNGEATEEIEVLFDTVNPPLNSVYDDIAIESLTNAQIGGELDSGTTYFWQVIAKNSNRLETYGPVWSFSTALGFFTLPVEEDFEPDFDKFNNALNNDIAWTLNTEFFHNGSNSAHNPYQESNINILMESGKMDLSNIDNPRLSFWQIAKSEGDYDHCYVEISVDGGVNWEILPISTYMGFGIYEEPTSMDSEGPCFDEDSYDDWTTIDIVPENTWWKEEQFDLTDYNEYSEVIIRFRLVSDSSLLRYGWLIDDISIVDSSVESNEVLSPQTVSKLENIYPNPFNPTTTISFSLTEKDTKNAKIEIYNLKGQKIKKLEIRNDKLGINKVVWNGKDEQGSNVSSGIYFIKMKTDNYEAIKKAILMK